MADPTRTPRELDPSSFRVLYSEAELAERCKELGDQLSRDYEGRPLTLVCVLKGAFIFAADLMRHLRIPARIDFVEASSYGDEMTTSGTVTLTKQLSQPVEGEHILLVEDIIDTGLTSAYLLAHLRQRGAASVKLITLLHKPSRTVNPVPIDYVGFEIGDEFVVGYGLDVAQIFRGLGDLRVFPTLH